MIVGSDYRMFYVYYYVSPLNTASAIDSIETGFLHVGQVLLFVSHLCHYYLFGMDDDKNRKERMRFEYKSCNAHHILHLEKAPTYTIQTRHVAARGDVEFLQAYMAHCACCIFRRVGGKGSSHFFHAPGECF